MEILFPTHQRKGQCFLVKCDILCTSYLEDRKMITDSTDLVLKNCKHCTWGTRGAHGEWHHIKFFFRLQLSVRMSDVKSQCQKALCLACPFWQVRKWSVLPAQHKIMAALQCSYSHICSLTINKFLHCQSPTVFFFFSPTLHSLP